MTRERKTTLSVVVIVVVGEEYAREVTYDHLRNASSRLGFKRSSTRVQK